MAAPKKNKFYKNRLRNGRELKFKGPTELLDKAYEYFDWCDNNPWQKKEAIKSGEQAGRIISIPTQRPYTIEQLCVYVGISVNTFKNYENRKDFLIVTTHVREIIEANQLEGAIVGAFSQNIIARKLGLADKKEVLSEQLITWVEEKTYEAE